MTEPLRATLRTIVTAYLSYAALLVTAGLIEAYTLGTGGWPFLAVALVYWFTAWVASLMFRNWLAGRKELVHHGALHCAVSHANLTR